MGMCVVVCVVVLVVGLLFYVACFTMFNAVFHMHVSVKCLDCMKRTY